MAKKNYTVNWSRKATSSSSSSSRQPCNVLRIYYIYIWYYHVYPSSRTLHRSKFIYLLAQNLCLILLVENTNQMCFFFLFLYSLNLVRAFRSGIFLWVLLDGYIIFPREIVWWTCNIWGVGPSTLTRKGFRDLKPFLRRAAWNYIWRSLLRQNNNNSFGFFFPLSRCYFAGCLKTLILIVLWDEYMGNFL